MSVRCLQISRGNYLASGRICRHAALYEEADFVLLNFTNLLALASSVLTALRRAVGTEFRRKLRTP